MSSGVSTLLPGFVLSALLFLSTRWAQSAQPATTVALVHQHSGMWQSPEPTPELHAMRGHRLPPSGHTEKAVNMAWSPAARLGLGLQPPRKVVTGRGARIRLWHRFRSLVLLAVIVVVGGSVLAGAVGLLLFIMTFLVEQAIG